MGAGSIWLCWKVVTSVPHALTAGGTVPVQQRLQSKWRLLTWDFLYTRALPCGTCQVLFTDLSFRACRTRVLLL